MFAKSIIDSDSFLEMPQSTQLLYFHLSLRADDDGFINKPKTIQRMVGCKDDDMKLLVAKQYIIPFDTGIVVIKHWRIHNYIQKDRYNETNCRDEKSLLTLDENKVYQLDTTCIQDGHTLDTQVRLGKDRLELGKDRIDIEGQDEPASKSQRHKYGKYKNVLLTDEDMGELQNEFSDWEDRIERLSSYIGSTGKKYKNHLITIRNWARKDKEKPSTERKSFSELAEEMEGFNEH